MLSFSFFGISLLAVLVFLFAGTPRVDATSAVVDDANTAQVTYSTGWKDFNDCTCLVKPTEASAYNGTFHSMTANGSTDVFFTFTFTGTSVEVRYIAIDIIRTGIVTNTNVSYWIDGVPRGTAVRNPEDRNSYVYDQSLFNVTGLTNVEHTLWVDLSPPSVLLLDYIVYEGEGANPMNYTHTTNTTNNPNTANTANITSTTNATNATSTPLEANNSTPTIPLGKILGGTLTGVFVLILAATLVWYLTNKKKRNRPKQQDNVPPPSDGQPGPPPPKDPYAPGSSSQRQSAHPEDMSWIEVDRIPNTVQTGTPGVNLDTNSAPHNIVP